MIVYNEEKVIQRALESVKGIVDEIIVMHDGPCSDNTLKIAKKYTKNIFIMPRKKRAALHMIDAFKKCKNDWMVKLDADEFLSTELRENINRLAQDKQADAYTFKWLLWNEGRYLSKNWPRKKSMFRKSKLSFLQFPGWDEPGTKGKVVQTDYLLEHRPQKGNDLFWSFKEYWKKALQRYGKTHAEYTLRDFDSFEKYQYERTDFPPIVRIRRKFPLLTAPIFSVVAFFKVLLSGGAWKEGLFVLKGATDTAIYYLWLGITLHKLKKER